MNAKAVAKPENYLYLAFIISLGHVIFMRFIFQEDWGYSPRANAVVGQMGSIVPMIKDLPKWHAYRPYWGMFYSIFWIISPIFLVLGFASVRNLGDKYLTSFKSQSRGKIYFIGLVILGALAFFFILPDAGSRFWFNELSDNIFVLSITLLQLSGLVFMLGFVAGRIRFKLHR